MSNFFWKLSFVILLVVLPPVLFPGSVLLTVAPALLDPVAPDDLPVLDFLVYCIFFKNY
jgi:hypothetical protein